MATDASAIPQVPDSGPMGAPGVSAFGVAVGNGFVGTEAEWLASLVGAAGLQGPAGSDGADSMVPGPAGIQGPAGPVGADGPQGEQGEVGPAGSDGADGSIGPIGLTGPIGPAGEQGPAGADGPAGPQGSEGPQGPQGPQGPAGEDGADGQQGAEGPAGATGPQGPIGPAGPIGPQGPAGNDGADGQDSTVPGPQGIQGEPGADGATIPAEISTLTLERNYLASADVTPGQNVNDTGTINITSSRLDTGWAQAGDSLEYVGEPDRVRIDVNVSQEIGNTDNIQRAAPVLVLQRNGIEVARSATGYIRDTSDHEQSTNTISFIDPTPGVDPTYSLVSETDTTITGATLVTLGSFSAEAVELLSFDVLAPPADDGTSGGGFGTAAGGTLANDNAQDQFGSFNLQVRNTTNVPVDWVTVWSGRPYSTIPALQTGPYVHTVIANGDGTFDHVFTGTAPLPPFGSLTIIGGGPTPAGDGDITAVANYLP